MNKKHYIIVALALVAAGANAQQTGTTGNQQGQQELHKEITLEKDFVPVEKKATKKNTLPTVKKVAAPAKTAVNYSDWANPVDVPTTIPTMMPYGYRTAHNFSDKRGYLDLGGGMAANFAGSAGYRIIDKPNLTLGAWVQHNSTWTAKNSSPLIINEADRLKQEFNDNLLGIDLMSRQRGGTLTVGARGHFDTFNYYGGTDPLWDKDNKQSFFEFRAQGGWEGLTSLSDHEVNYSLNAVFNHAGYDHSLLKDIKGDKENTLNLTLGGEVALNDFTRVGLEVAGDYVSSKHPVLTESYFLTTLSPYFLWENDRVRAQVGADVVLGNLHMYDFGGKRADGMDGARVHVSPNVALDFKLADGAGFYVALGGGKILNTLSDMAAQNRYSDPSARYFNSFTPFDGEAGFKIGPFSGFSVRVFGGYGIFLGDLNAELSQTSGLPGSAQFSNMYIEVDPEQPGYTIAAMSPYQASLYKNYKFRGMKVGGELNYKYRSLVDAKASVVFSPAGDDISRKGWNKGYSFGGFDGPSLIGNVDVQVTPIRQLAIDLGLQIRCMRSVIQHSVVVEDVEEWQLVEDYDYFDLDDVFNLHAGASWKFDKTLTLWVKGNNLLNRKYDAMPGMGAQKLNIMGGFALVF